MAVAPVVITSSTKTLVTVAGEKTASPNAGRKRRLVRSPAVNCFWPAIFELESHSSSVKAACQYSAIINAKSLEWSARDPEGGG